MSETPEAVREASSATTTTISVAGARPELVAGTGDELNNILGELVGALDL
jgi:hypothetical protein